MKLSSFINSNKCLESDKKMYRSSLKLQRDLKYRNEISIQALKILHKKKNEQWTTPSTKYIG